MSSVAFACITVLILACIFAGLSVWHARHEAEREDKNSAREESESATIVDLTERLTTTLISFERSDIGARLEQLEEEVRTGLNANTKDAVLALSERVAIMEAAMKAAIAQMVNTAGYSEEKYRQLIAASVRSGSAKRPGVGA